MDCRKCDCELTVGNYGEADVELYNSVYGCDTGCEYVRFKVNCPRCGDSFETGEFGFFDTEEERIEHLVDFSVEYYGETDQ